MKDLFLIVVVLLILAGADAYIIKQKKNGVKCIGCPDAKTCASRRSGCPACNGGCKGCSGYVDCPSAKQEAQ